MLLNFMYFDNDGDDAAEKSVAFFGSRGKVSLLHLHQVPTTSSEMLVCYIIT